MSEAGQKRLKDLAKAAREKVTASGDTQLHKKGLVLVELLAREFSATGDEGFPGLRVWRDAASKFRLTRPPRNAEISVEWQRAIGAAVVSWEKHGEPKTTRRYLLDEEADTWKFMDGEGELWDDLATAMADVLYPETKPKT